MAYHFGDCILDPNDHSLRCGNQVIPLRPKTFETLLYLVENHDRIVTKEDLLKEIWAESYVVETVVSHSVSELRSVLEETPQYPKYIKTIPKVGYKFIAEVAAIDDSDRKRKAGLGSIAVLPFRDMSPEKDLGYLCEGLAEEIINALAHIKGLRVAARTSTFCFRDKDVDVREIGQRLGVDAVLEGSLRVLEDDLRLSVQLIETSDGFHLWSDQLDCEMRTVFLVGDHLSQQIVENLKNEKLPEGEAAPPRRGTENPDAYLLYLKGRYLLCRENVQDLRRALDYFDQAVRITPDYADAHSSLSASYLLLGFWNALPPPEALSKARNAAVRAVEADPASSLAHEALSFVTLLNDWDWWTAEKASRRAIELAPNSSSAHTIRCIYLTAMGRLEEAIAESLRSVELDPLSNLTNSYLAWSLLRRQHLEEAIEQLEMTLELEPSDPRTRMFLGQAYVLDARFDEGIAEIQRALDQSHNNSLILSGLGWAYALAGRRAEAFEIVAKLKERFKEEHPRPYLIAKVYSGLKEKDLAFEWLEEAFRQHDTSLAFVKTDESLVYLRGDPRFVDLLRRMNLEP